MPTHEQITVEPSKTERGLGSSGTQELSSVFGSSPISGAAKSVTKEERKKFYQDKVLNGTINDEGHTFGKFELDYSEAPDLKDVEVGDGGKPASPYVPNPTSPGEGSDNPADQGKAPDGYGKTPSSTPFVGVGSQLSPKASSVAISGQTLGDYGFGKSSK